MTTLTDPQERLAESLYRLDAADGAPAFSALPTAARDHYLRRAADLTPMVEQLNRLAAVAALHESAAEIEAELICCPDDDVAPGHHICRWAIAARKLVLSRAERLAS